MVRIIISILLFISFTSKAQMPYFHAHNYTSFVYDYLLDDYPSAYGAYSLRKLKSSYSGYCIKVRRSSDNTEQDIGFLNNILDTNSLKTFVGANNGFVSVWYDQSGNSRNFTQTTNAEQPYIITSGVIFRQDDYPSINFGTWSNTYWLYTASGYLYNVTELAYIQVATVHSDTSISTGHYGTVFNNAAGSTGFEVMHFPVESAPAFTTRINAVYRNIGPYTSQPENNFMNNLIQCLSIFNGTPSGLSQYKNGTGVYTTNNSSMPTLSYNGVYQLGKYNAGTSNNGYFNMQELVLYTSSQSSNRTGIETNINNFYTIY